MGSGHMHGFIKGLFLKLNQALWKKPFLQKMRILFYVLDSVLLFGLKAGRKKTGEKKKVLVMYNLALGDAVMFLGAAGRLRDIYPVSHCKLDIACQAGLEELYLSTGIFDRVIPIDFIGAAVNLRLRRQMFRILRQECYDILLDPVGSGDCTMNLFASRAVCALEKIGVLDKTLGCQCPQWLRRNVYSRVITISRQMHLIQFYSLCLMKLGAAEFKPHPAVLAPAELRHVELPDQYFIVYPSASMGVKRWPVEKFAQIARRIYQKTGWCLLVCGTDLDKAVTDQFLALIPDVPVCSLIGKTSIMEFIEVIGRAKMILTNDTSVYHIGVAKQVDTVIVCGGYTYERYAHYQYSACGFKDPVLVSRKMECFDCGNRCRYKGYDIYPCISRIGLEDVWKAVKSVIEK